MPTNPPEMMCAASLSNDTVTARAGREVIDECSARLDGQSPALAVCFMSTHHVERGVSLAAEIREALTPDCFVAVSAESTLGGTGEIEGAPGVSLFTLAGPGIQARSFQVDELPKRSTGGSTDAIAAAAGMDSALRATLLFADPFSVPMTSVLQDVADARAAVGRAQAPVLGGMASGAASPGQNLIVLDDRASYSGGVGVSLCGALTVDALVSQGCRPFGPPLVVTACKRQMLLELAGRPALEMLAEIVQSMDERERERLQNGIFLGRAVSEYRERFGRGDFLIRNVVGYQEDRNAIAVAELLRVGQTVQFHTRDAATAAEDLALLLDGQKLHGVPSGVLAFTCNGRGRRLFGRADADVTTIRRAFGDLDGALNASEQPASLPMGGFSAAGEIGPIGDGVFVHGQTACLGLIRPRATEGQPGEIRSSGSHQSTE